MPAKLQFRRLSELILTFVFKFLIKRLVEPSV